MNQKKLVFVAQIFISGMMAFLMTFFFSALNLGFNEAMVREWLGSFVIAWPVAFLFSLMVSPIAFFFSAKLVAPKDTVAD